MQFEYGQSHLKPGAFGMIAAVEQREDGLVQEP